MINRFIKGVFFQRKISVRLLILTLLFSAMITFVITVIQLYMDYRNGFKSIDDQLSLVESSYLASVSQSVWVYDSEQVYLQLDGMLSLPDIEYTSIDLKDGTHFERGEPSDHSFIARKYPIKYVQEEKYIDLGELTVIADLHGLYKQLTDKIIVILFSQGIKTFLTSFFILFIFQRLVTNHIQKIVSYTRSLDLDIPGEPLSLDKSVIISKEDELDELADSINSMQSQICRTFQDVSDELEKRIIAERSLIEYKKALDASSYVSKCGLDGKITYMNEALLNITGYKREELIGRPSELLRYQDLSLETHKAMRKTIQDKQVWHGNMENRKKDGSSFYVHQTIIPILDTQGDIVEYITSSNDITELVENRKALERLYKTDPLTGLGNRMRLLGDIDDVESPAMAIVDIDDFKEINDFYGNVIGDQVIVEFADRLQRYAKDDLYDVYRLHADQFALFCKRYTTREHFQKRVKKIVENSTLEIVVLQQYEILLGVAVGIAFDKRDLYINTDMALKTAKKEKKNFVTYQKALNIEKEYEKNLEWTKRVKKALDDDRITAFFQPIYDLRGKRIEKFEALVRMIDVDGEVISPFFFLDIAVRSKLYTNITIIMIDKAIEAAIKYDYQFSINFTIDDIRNVEVTAYLIERVKANDVGHKIVIELVESEGITDFTEIHTFIEEIKTLGCQLAIDDFGTGYSNFEYLLRLDADYIKIDGSLIKNIDKDRHMRLVAENIVAFAKIANMKTIAEFVYDQKIADITVEIDVDYIQGYHISEPVTYDEISRFEEYK